MVDLEVQENEIKQSQIQVVRVPIWHKLNLTIEEAAEYSNIGQNRIRKLIKKPRCPFVIYVGKKMLIKRKEFEKFISEQIEI